MPLNFDNTEIAYQYLSNQKLKKSHFVFKILNNNFLSKIGKSFTMKAFDLGLPIKGIVKNTVFDAFVGGESIEESKPEIEMLQNYNVGAILDYGIEAKDEEHELDAVASKIISIIEQINPNEQKGLETCAKITAFAKNDLLEKVTSGEPLNDSEKQLWNKVIERLDKVCAKAHEKGVKLYIDAEESWIQDAIDQLVDLMMAKYNKEQPIIFNTIQLYRHDRFDFLVESYEKSIKERYLLAVKLVRGAYMEKENERANQLNYTSPIHLTKEDTDKDYNKGVEFCVEHIEQIAFCVATHNEESNYYLDELIQEKDISNHHPHIITAQLFGMGDHITFNMAEDGYNATKYLPFGPVKELLPYLLRRANENSSVDGQASRELTLVKKEMKRRRI